MTRGPSGMLLLLAAGTTGTAPTLIVKSASPAGTPPIHCRSLLHEECQALSISVHPNAPSEEAAAYNFYKRSHSLGG